MRKDKIKVLLFTLFFSLGTRLLSKKKTLRVFKREGVLEEKTQWLPSTKTSSFGRSLANCLSVAQESLFNEGGACRRNWINASTIPKRCRPPIHLPPYCLPN
ncbi:hypothetical protein CEXT_732611 [Caerostris extrusa]|uniref:Secreted protein n=1 Tax=Caerostris extrusa TaxID=172846 RepID=A0AAV4QY32_CAEEX|nr:hypothetical protein CEXT_732611 [Caerostris extrusa]